VCSQRSPPSVIPTEAHDKVPQGQPAATSGGFIVGDRGVLVVDTMLSARLAGQLIGLVRLKRLALILQPLNPQAQKRPTATHLLHITPHVDSSCDPLRLLVLRGVGGSHVFKPEVNMRR